MISRLALDFRILIHPLPRNGVISFLVRYWFILGCFYPFLLSFSNAFIHLGPFEILKLINYDFITFHWDSRQLVDSFMMKCCKMVFLPICGPKNPKIGFW